MSEIEIDDNNFSHYFRSMRSPPEKGDVIAQYTAVAELVDGNEKRQIISLLTSTEDKMEATAQVMRKLLHASEIDAYRVPRMMAEDMLSGMDEEEVAMKPYRYTLEMFFYSKPEFIPKGDPHWSSISVINAEDLMTSAVNAVESKIIIPEESAIGVLES